MDTRQHCNKKTRDGYIIYIIVNSIEKVAMKSKSTTTSSLLLWLSLVRSVGAATFVPAAINNKNNKAALMIHVQPNTAAIITTATCTTKSSTQLNSVPNPFDTLTSGLASICRLPKGVTAMEITPTPDGELDVMPKFQRLYDIENSLDCRVVREYLTELDATVEQVIPSSANARVFTDPSHPNALPMGTEVPRLEVEESNGMSKTLSGKDEIVAYLEELQQTQASISKAQDQQEEDQGEEEKEKEAIDATIEELKDIALHAWNAVGNVLATGFRIGRGREVAAPALADLNSQTVPRPQKPLVLYNYEGNQFCRLVREVLTELDIPWEMRSAGKQSPRRQELAYITGGSSQCPYLIDPNTGVDMAESKDMVEYLYKTYARWTPPNELLEWASHTILPLAKPLFQFLTPLQAGSSGEDTDAYEAGITNAMDEIDQETQQYPITVYTYDWSPFSQETKALLKRLDISFHEISLGREWIPGLIKEGGSEKRAALLEMTGQSSLPHIFIGGQSIGGLFSGTPGLIPVLKEGKLSIMVESANEIFNKRNVPGGTKTTTKATTPAPATVEKEQEEEVVGAFE